jgi:hypothetical protein
MIALSLVEIDPVLKGDHHFHSHVDFLLPSAHFRFPIDPLLLLLLSMTIVHFFLLFHVHYLFHHFVGTTAITVAYYGHLLVCFDSFDLGLP